MMQNFGSRLIKATKTSKYKEIISEKVTKSLKMRQKQKEQQLKYIKNVTKNLKESNKNVKFEKSDNH